MGSDITFAARRLSERTVDIPVELVTQGLPVFAVGHSLGGAAAFAACGEGTVFVGCVSLDGFNLGPITRDGLRVPGMIVKSEPVYSDEDLEARGRTRESWEAMASEAFAGLVAPLTRSTAAGFYVGVRGTGHLSFSDAPFLFPEAITRFGGTYPSPERTLDLTVSLLLSFFDGAVAGDPAAPLEVVGIEAEVSVRQVSLVR